MTPLVSVIMPAFNAERFIGSAVESVISQTFLNWELIIINDGSTDDTAALISHFTKIDPRIKYIEQDRGKQGKARNNGIKISQCKYIAFLDADDLWDKDKLEIQIREIEQSKSTDLIFSQGYQIEDDELIKEINVVIKSTWDKNDFSQFLDFNQIPILSVLVRKQALLTVNCFDESSEIQNVEDYHLWLKLLINNFKFRSIPNRLFYYRVHCKQSTYKNEGVETSKFFAYKNIYYYCTELLYSRAILNKLKWYLFSEQFYPECIKIATYHFEKDGKSLLSIFVRNFLVYRSRISQRILFQLITIYG